MDRNYIYTHNVIERYLMGKLPEKEAVEFEDLFVFDKELREEVEDAEILIYGIRKRVNDSSKTEADTTPARHTHVHGRVHWAIAAAFAGVAALIPFLYYKTQLSESQLHQQELLSMLAAERAPSIASQATMLVRTRTGESSLPALSIPIPQEVSADVVLAVPILDKSFSLLALSLSTNGDVIWSSDWSRADPVPENLLLSIPSTILQPGIYELTVESRNDSRDPVSERFRFRAHAGTSGFSDNN